TDLPSRGVGDAAASRFAHHLVWPHRRPDTVGSILVAGCGTSQAVRQAVAHPEARVVAIDVAANSIEHTNELARRHGVTNLDVHHLAIEDVVDLGEQFDLVVCTGVLHHLADPGRGLRCLRDVLAPGGAIKLMVYARYGRTGVYMMQDYCRRLGVEPTSDELADLVATLSELPLGHPLGRLLRETRDFADDDAVADALLNPRDRAYSVPELCELIDDAALRFGRWERQAPYLPDCGSVSETPHAARIAAMPPTEQYAALELFRGTIARHTAVVFDASDDASGALDFASGPVAGWIPLRAPTVVTVQERLPPGVAAALINRAHTDTDLVCFVDRAELDVFEAIDGTRTIADLGARATAFVERWWRHDLVSIDASEAA
ncbi:MAG: class I SAM-dependent methyltransferase, partial [Ilumatobacteraceae bacterium]